MSQADAKMVDALIINGDRINELSDAEKMLTSRKVKWEKLR